MSGHVRGFVENFPVCQMEKSDHTLSKGKLQSTHIPESKWSEISIDFITDLLVSSRNRDSVLVIVDKATRMVHLAPCSKSINATTRVTEMSAADVDLGPTLDRHYSDVGSRRRQRPTLLRHFIRRRPEDDTAPTPPPTAE